MLPSTAKDRFRRPVVGQGILQYIYYKCSLLLYPTELWSQKLERVMGIEPTLLAWKAKVLPLNYTRFYGYLKTSMSLSVTTATLAPHGSSVESFPEYITSLGPFILT
jgi:hypothetical protein